MAAQMIALANQKGGVSKTTSCINLGIGLANAGKKVLLVDFDAQGSMTIGLGYPRPDQISVTVSTIMERFLTDEQVNCVDGILHHKEGVDLIPADIQLSAMEFSLVNVMSREKVLKQCLEGIKDLYDYILIDCPPSLGMLTINALAAANKVIIPVQAEYLPAKGLEALLKTINRVRRMGINPGLAIEGILLSMVNKRTNFAKEIIELIHETYGGEIHVFETEIPYSVRAKETSAEGKSIFAYDPRGKVADAYKKLSWEVISNEEGRR